MATNYRTLRAKARYLLARERPGHLLEPAAVVNEAYIRMKKRSGEPWNDEAHVVRGASIEMRRGLVEHARAKGTVKRGGRMQHVPWDDAVAIPAEQSRTPELLLALDELLNRLEKFEPQMVAMINLHHLEGYEIKQIAEEMNVSESTVKSKLIEARRWLRGHLLQGAEHRIRQNGKPQEAMTDTRAVERCNIHGATDRQPRIPLAGFVSPKRPEIFAAGVGMPAA
jgi:RNA polymerase sigma factor (TIGR02999 family)